MSVTHTHIHTYQNKRSLCHSLTIVHNETTLTLTPIFYLHNKKQIEKYNKLKKTVYFIINFFTWFIGFFSCIQDGNNGICIFVCYKSIYVELKTLEQKVTEKHLPLQIQKYTPSV